ncbi:hypothetical protein LTR94_002417 [Friedmanniomyces endolithicus]|nr:hypothetical protein LTR94_002417 [Friedmanniomyces endolithicus]
MSAACFGGLGPLQEVAGQAVIEALATEDLGGCVGDQCGAQQRQHEAAAAGGFRNDDDGGQWRAHHAGEIGDHAQQHDGARRFAGENPAQQIAEAGAGGERGGEDAAGNARDAGGEGAEEFGGGEPERLVAARDHGEAGGHADRRHQQATAAGEQHRMGPHPVGHAIARSGGVERQPREQAAGHAAQQPGQQRDGNRRLQRQMGGDRAEIDIVASDAEADHARDDDCGDDQQGHALLIGGGQFLDREGNAGERRVEGGGNAGRAARDHDGRAQGHVQQSVDAGKDGGGNLDGGAFAADRGADQQAGDGQHDLQQRHAQVNQAAADLFRQLGSGDHLRDARSAGKGRDAAGDPGEGGKAKRGQQQRQPAIGGGEAMESLGRFVCGPGEGEGSEADQHGAADQGEATAEQQGCRPAMAQQRAGAAAAPALAGAAHDGRCAPGRD